MNPIKFSLSDNTSTDPTEINLELGSSFSFVDETVTNFSNNTTYSQVGQDPFAISIVPPDINLVVTDITAPATVASGQTFSLSWTVQNQGTTPTNSSYWYDRLVYSTDDIFGNEDDVYLNQVPTYYYVNNLPLDPNESYTITQDITVPNALAGQGYLLLNTDQYNYQAENNETDNVKAVAVNVIPPDINLVVTDITAPATVASGQTFSLSWTVQNQGIEATTYDYWYDRLVYSTDDIFGNEDDVYLNQVPTDYYVNNLPLDPNESYTITQDITVPNALAGQGYLLLNTDQYNYQAENNETDNVKAVAVNVIPPDINLVVTDITAPATVVSGQTFSLSWTVQNQGIEATTASYLYDRVVYSTDDIFGNEDDVYLTDIPTYYYVNNLPLDPNESYTITQDITVPNDIAGQGYLLLNTDQYNNQAENNETDNVKAVAVNVIPPDINLVVTDITAPATVVSGQTFSLSWTVQNQGIEATTASYLYDRVVYSTDDIFGNGDDVYLNEFDNYYYYNLPLDPNESYTITQDITVPNALTGQGYLLLNTDQYNYQAENNETDNVKAVAVNVIPPDINLVVTDITTPATVVLGQTFSLSWTVQNQGIEATTASYWYDRVVYSTDDIFGNEDDVYLTDVPTYYYVNNLLDPNESYTITQDIAVPNDITGQGYLLLNTDQYNSQPENNETDNVKAVAVNVIPPDINLVVTDITAPATVVSGQTFSLSWTVQNQGTTPTNTYYLYDRLVYSTDDIFGNEDDVYLNEVPTYYYVNNLPLDPNESYTITQDITVANDLTGQGYLLLNTDIYNNQAENNETDNVKAVAVNVIPPDINLVVTDITAPATVVSGQTFSLSWTVQNQGIEATTYDHWYDRLVYSTDDIFGNEDDVYLNEVPTYYYVNNLPLDPNESYTITQDITVPNDIAGQGYLLLNTDQYNYQAENNETDNVKAVAVNIIPPDINLVVTDITAPATVASGQTFSLSWTVQNQGTTPTNTYYLYDRVVYSTDDIFGNEDDVYLTDIPTYYYNNLPLDPNESYTITQDITVPNDIAGQGYLLLNTDQYNYQAENNETDNVKAVAVNIIPPDINLVVTDITAPATVASGQTFSLSWTVQNQGTTSTISNYWYDSLVYSTDDIFGNEDDVYLTDIPTYYYNNLPLDPNESYTITQDITVPNDIAGQGYLLLNTDQYNYQAENNETDNVKAVAVNVIPPDINLVVTDITAPATVVSGQTFSLSWTVQNQGIEATTASYLYDRVVYSTDDIFGNGDDVYLNEFDNYYYYNLPLDPNESYTITQDITVPNALTGQGYLLLNTDQYNYQAENNETDNVKAVAVNVIPPDINLVVTDITTPATVVLGQTFSLSWTVQNQGIEATTASYWYDRVVYSTDDIFGNEDDVYLTDVPTYYYVNNLLDPNESYTITQDIAVPNDITGQGYLLLNTDQYNSQPENNETDNVKAVAVNVIPPDINLVVTDITAPATVASGQTFSLSWTVQNQGTTPTNSSYWYDRLVYSTDDIFGNEDDVYLNQVPTYYYVNNLPLDPNESYTITQDITVPNALAGQGYLLLNTDQYNYQAENNETDNVKAVAVNVIPPDINLVVTDITAPATVASGQTFSLSWTVQNQGIEATTYDYWYDRLVYSTDDIFGNEDDVYLNQVPTDYYVNNLPLDPNESYTITQDITVPNALAGQGYLLLNTDQYNYQAENNETDNVKAVAVNVIPPDINLVVTDITAPATVVSGQTFSLSWTVQNQGIEATTASYLYDRVVYSTDDIFGNEDDVYLTDIPTYYYVNNLPLDPNESYTITQDITVPNDIAGQGYLLLNTDQYNNQAENNETDNVKAVAVNVIPPDINLVVTDITAPATVVSGQTFSLSWTVQNQGIEATTASYLYDRVVYSTDDIFGNEDDVYLAQLNTPFYVNNLPLDPNESYTITQDITVPNDITGQGYLLLNTDQYNYQPENDETDNVKAVAVNIIPPDINLVVTDITAPATVASGQTFSLSWTVQNQGIEATTSDNWYDRVVYSTDDIFGNGDDVYLNEVPTYYYNNLPLDPNESYTITQDITVPNDIAGQGYLLLKTDQYNYQAENNETDNVKAVAVNIIPPDINLVVTDITAPATVVSGQTFSLSWTVQNQGTIPTNPYIYDLSDRLVYSTDDIFGNGDDVYLYQFPTYYYVNNLPLDPNESYTITQDITVPNDVTGQGYLLLNTDLYNNQTENNETDNVKAVAINFTQPHAPTDIQISNLSISENALNNSLVGRFKAVDQDTNDTHTYQLLNPENLPFSVVDNELRVSGKLDYETKTNYQLQVRTTDQDGLSFDKTLTVNIQDDRDFDITGTSGDDIIVGGIGGDLMQGNGGKDIFQYNNYKENGDTIIDFNPINDDLFDLKNLYTNPRINLGTDPFNSYIKVTQLGANTRIDFAPFANLAPNYFLPLATVENVNASQIDSSDFIFI